MKLKLTIRMDNAAFDPSHGEEVARILKKVAEGVRDFDDLKHYADILRDINGNTVGSVEVRP